MVGRVMKGLPAETVEREGVGIVLKKKRGVLKVTRA